MTWGVLDAEQRVAVGRGFRHEVRADHAARARAVVDHHLLAEEIRQLRATMRITTSFAPPAEYGTIRRTGLFG